MAGRAAALGGTVETRNVKLQIAAGALLLSASTLAGANGVLTWLAVHMHVSIIAAALVYPMSLVGNMIAQFVLSGALDRRGRRKTNAIWIAFVNAGLLVLLVTLVPYAWGAVGALFLLVGVMVLGVFRSLFGVVNTDLKKHTLTRANIGRSMFVSASVGGGLTLIAVLLVHSFDTLGQAGHRHLLWAAVGAWLVLMLAIAGMTELPSQAPASAVAPKADAAARSTSSRMTLLGALRIRWFRRLCFANFAFLTVEIAIPFYVIHAAVMHAPTLKNALMIAVALAAGEIIGGWVWNRFPRDKPWLVCALASVAAASASLFVLFSEATFLNDLGHMHFLALVVVSTARLGTRRARKTIVIGAMPHHGAARLIGIYNGVGTAAAVVGAVVLGAAGELHNAILPLLILTAANLLAAAYALAGLRRLYDTVMDGVEAPTHSTLAPEEPTNTG